MAITGFDVFSPRTTSSSRITLAGEKKCMPSTSSGRLVTEAISSMFRYEVLEARIAPGLAIVSSLREHLLLDVHVLEHRLDHQVAVGQRVEVERRAEQPHARLDVGLRQPALLGGVLVVAADGREAAVERLLLRSRRSSPGCRR